MVGSEPIQFLSSKAFADATIARLEECMDQADAVEWTVSDPDGLSGQRPEWVVVADQDTQSDLFGVLERACRQYPSTSVILVVPPAKSAVNATIPAESPIAVIPEACENPPARVADRLLDCFDGEEIASDDDQRIGGIEGVNPPVSGFVTGFDSDGRHWMVVESATDTVDATERNSSGPNAAGQFEPATLLGNAFDTAGTGEAAAYLAADCRKSIGGTACTRDVKLAGTWFRVSMRPHRVGASIFGGIASFDRVGAGKSVAGETDTRDRIETVLQATTELEDLESREAVYEAVLPYAETLVDADAAGIGELVDGKIETRAGTADELHVESRLLQAGEGIAGGTIERNESIWIDDREEQARLPWGNPDAAVRSNYRSVLSVPIGAAHVFQALSREPGTYTAADLEVVELLCRPIGQTLNRLDYEAALTRERDRFAALFENVPDAAVQYVDEGDNLRIESVNGAFVRLFGYDPEAVVGRAVGEILIPEDEVDPPEHREMAVPTDASENATPGKRSKVQRTALDGPRPFWLRTVPVGSEDDDRGYLIYTDITDLIAREQELEAQNERLDRFASIVSHDLRNPLSIAIGYTQLVQETGDLERLELATDALDRMDRMIQELLSLARHGRVISDTTTISLEDVASEAWQHVDTGDASLSLGTVMTFEGDRERVLELLENCYRNAVEHGGPDVSITVGSTTNGFYVADDGEGVPADEIDHVLEHGYTNRPGGTGIGLSIVSEIVEAHGWSLAVSESEAGGFRLDVDFT